LKPNSGADVFTILRGLRRRLVIRLFLDALATGALLAAGVWLVLEIVTWLSGKSLGDFRIALAGMLLVPAALVLARRRSLAQIAALADARGRTKDRFVTALALSRETQSPVAELARAECSAYLSLTDFRPLIPLHPPRAGAWLVVPFIALALLRLDLASQRSAARIETEKAQAAVADTVGQIEQLTQQVKKANEQARSEELKKLTEQLQRSAERLRTETKSDEAKKAALRELSSLEQMLRDLQRQPSPADEMKELAKALAPLPGMPDVLKALDENNLAEAQKALERANQAQKGGAPDQPTEEQIEKALREAVQGLADRRRLSQALQRLAEQMKQAGGQSPSQQAMQQLSQMLQQAQPGEGSSSQRQMTLQEMIAALENMKFDGEQNQNGQGKPGAGGDQKVTMQSFVSKNSQGQPKPGSAETPSGEPGSERDFGTTENPFGAKNDPQDKGGELALKGKLGAGEALSMMLPSASDKSRAARRYKDLYDAAAASAQDAVQQENIPLGSRFLIKRYFESIRPQE
jgi:hypothetical protein